MAVNWKTLFVQWLEEAYEAANAKPNATYLVQAYQKSLASVSSCPLDDFTEVSQLKSLKFVGDKTVAMLLKKAESHSKKTGDPLPEGLKLGTHAPAASQSAFAKPSSKRKYIPRYGTTAYHLLLAIREQELEEHVEDCGVGRKDLLRRIKPRLMLSLEGHAGKQIPSLAPAFAVLTKNELIYYRNTKYYLEETGRAVADGLLKVFREQNGLPIDDIVTSQTIQGPSAARYVEEKNTFRHDVWKKGDFTIKLLLDNREVASRDNRSGFADALGERNVPLEISALAVGDAVWVAEHKTSGKLAVLDYIVERKSLRDLVQSIMDGRFFEQKTRLKRSQIQNVIYLIEMVGGGPEMASHAQRIRTAMSQIIALRGFYLKQTASQNETVLYLSQLTEEIAAQYAEKDLAIVLPHVGSYETSMAMARDELGDNIAIDFEAFHEGLSKSKSQTVAQMFVGMLMTIKGVSAEKAQVIQRMFPTPLDLYRAYQELGSEDHKQLLLNSRTQHNIPRRKIRPDVSAMIYEVWGKRANDSQTTDVS